jgi:hypothetical protein
MTPYPEVIIAPAMILSPVFFENESDSPVINASDISRLSAEINTP